MAARSIFQSNFSQNKLVYLTIVKLLQTYNDCFKQDDTLMGELASVDVATKENLNNLGKVGEQLLTKRVTRVNLDTGICEPVQDKGSNEEELKRFILLNNNLFIL